MKCILIALEVNVIILTNTYVQRYETVTIDKC